MKRNTTGRQGKEGKHGGMCEEGGKGLSPDPRTKILTAIRMFADKMPISSSSSSVDQSHHSHVQSIESIAAGAYIIIMSTGH